MTDKHGHESIFKTNTRSYFHMLMHSYSSTLLQSTYANQYIKRAQDHISNLYSCILTLICLRNKVLFARIYLDDSASRTGLGTTRTGNYMSREINLLCNLQAQTTPVFSFIIWFKLAYCCNNYPLRRSLAELATVNVFQSPCDIYPFGSNSYWI